jgi:pimeloyl-ACP methyl ester carboxylesterase
MQPSATPPKTGAAIARLPDGHLEIINGLGHVPHVEDPRLAS